MTLPGYEIPGKKYDVTYISLGAGVQSSALLLMSNLGLYDIPRADVAIFADTGAEPPDVYRVLDELEKASSIPVVRVQEGDLEADYRAGLADKSKSFRSLPTYTMDPDTKKRGIVMRQCTAHWKIRPIHRYVREEMLGLKPRQRSRAVVLTMMGISFDEAQRMKPSRVKWTDHSFPLVDRRIRREKCSAIIEEHGGADGWPVKVGASSCYFCPFHGQNIWRAMKERDHIDGLFTRACEFDEAIRHHPRMRSECFLHPSCKPLREVDLEPGPQMEFDFMGCDSGHCGI